MKKEKEKDKENHEGDVSYNPKRNSEKIHQQEEERSIDIESNNQEEEEKEVKEKIIDRMTTELSMIYKHYSPKDMIDLRVPSMSVINTIHQ